MAKVTGRPVEFFDERFTSSEAERLLLDMGLTKKKRKESFLSDLFDFSIYVDADASHIERWYVDRFLTLRHSAFSNPKSFFNVFIDVPNQEMYPKSN